MGKTYGIFVYHVEDDQTDRIGIRTLILSKGWLASSGLATQEQLDDEIPNTPSVPGGMLLIGRQTHQDGGGLRTFWTFEGVNGDGRGVTFRDRTNSLDQRFEPGFSQVSIVKHPRWAALKATYGGELIDGQVIWPDTIQSSGAAGFAGASSGKVNPMFGHDDFLRAEGTYFYRYASRAEATMSGVGQVHPTGALPGKPPRFPGRNWLKMAPAQVRRGTVNDITEGYWLSGAGGWPPQIYSDGKGSGGVAGSLQVPDLSGDAGAGGLFDPNANIPIIISGGPDDGLTGLENFRDNGIGGNTGDRT